MSLSPDSEANAGEKVHVAFLGWEIDRIVQPVLEKGGNRLILICFPREKEGAWEYLEEIKRLLEDKGVVVEIVENSLHDLVSLISILNRIFQLEKSKGNEVFVNVSAGTKITACASTVAAMSMEGINPYYVNTEEYYPKSHFKFPQTLTKGIKNINLLPRCQIQVPEEKYIRCLHAIRMARRKKREGNKVYYLDLIEILKKQGLINVKKNADERKQKSSEYMAMGKILRELESWGFVKISPKRRNKFVTLTKEGEDAIDMYFRFDTSREVPSGRLVNALEKMEKILKCSPEDTPEEAVDE